MVSRRRVAARKFLVGAAALAAVGGAGGPMLVGTAAAAPAHLAAATPAAASLPVTYGWSRTFASAVAQSSPTVANLDGQPDVVVGDSGGNLQAFDLSNGATVGGFPVSTGSLPVASPPSVSGNTLFVGTGNAAASGGAYRSYANNGALRWSQTVATLPGGATPASVITGLSVGTLQGIPSVVSGSLGQQELEINAGNGTVNPGFPWFEADTNFSTPAIADLYGNGQNEIIEGGDSSAGVAYNRQYGNGGHVRVLSATGNAGTGNPGGGLSCNLDVDQTVQSSPAVGTFLPGGANGIVVGTGATFSGASTTNDLIATNQNCQVAWETKLDGTTTSSPALVDALGNGGLQIAEGADTGGNGTVYLLNGAGGVIWSQNVIGRIYGGASITSADFGEGYQDLVVPTLAGAEILDGKTGAEVAVLNFDAVGLQSSPLVTHDPNGELGITLAGYTSSGGEVVHYEVGGSNGALATEAGAWPEFHHDPQLTGDAGTAAPVVQVPCNAPSAPHGYDMFASDGGVFSYGNAPFCGSTGNLQLRAPVTTGSTTADLGGYWEAATDGGVFAFGDAGFHGAASSYGPAAPIVGLAATPDGGGYWEVGADGGIFAFGDAGYYGSAAPYHPRKPIVGMAATADGKGYWLVASDGGIFAFGDARFAGSAGNLALVRPVVGMTPDPATGGYWLVASDGGLFAYGAPFYGSEGGAPLARPMVGIDQYAGGAGYRMVASDGGVFAFHASFYGSAGNLTLAKPVVGLSGRGT